MRRHCCHLASCGHLVRLIFIRACCCCCCSHTLKCVPRKSQRLNPLAPSALPAGCVCLAIERVERSQETNSWSCAIGHQAAHEWCTALSLLWHGSNCLRTWRTSRDRSKQRLADQRRRRVYKIPILLPPLLSRLQSLDGTFARPPASDSFSGGGFLETQIGISPK